MRGSTIKRVEDEHGPQRVKRRCNTVGAGATYSDPSVKEIIETFRQQRTRAVPA